MIRPYPLVRTTVYVWKPYDERMGYGRTAGGLPPIVPGGRLDTNIQNMSYDDTGSKAALPIVLGYLPAAMAFGVAAREAGLSVAEAVLCSLIIFSGASQFALVGLLGAGASWLVALPATLLLTVRHALYGPVLAPKLRGLGARRSLAAAFGLTDEVFAVASAGLPERGRFRRLMTLEAAAYGSWALGTLVGASAGSALVTVLPGLAPVLGYALPALFVALLAPQLAGRGLATRRVREAVVVAATVAAVLQMLGLQQWSVLAAAVAGPLAVWEGDERDG